MLVQLAGMPDVTEVLERFNSAFLIELQVADQSRFRDAANPAYLPVLQSEAFEIDRFYSLLHFRVRMLVTFEVKCIQLFWSEFNLDHSWPHIRNCPLTMPQSG